MRATGRRPWQAGAAFGCYIAAAVVAAIVGGLLVAVLPGAAQAQGVSVAVQQSRVATLTGAVIAIVGVYVVAVVGLALLFRSGRSWARLPLALVSATSLVAIAGIGAVVIALVVAADILAFWGPVTRWLRDEPELPRPARR